MLAREWSLLTPKLIKAGDNAPRLKWIFKYHIVTLSTMGIMDLAAGVDYDTLDTPWPGIEYRPNDEEFTALLGTPHGKFFSELTFTRDWD